MTRDFKDRILVDRTREPKENEFVFHDRLFLVANNYKKSLNT